MMRTPQKSISEGDLQHLSDSNSTPPNNECRRYKRKRSTENASELTEFKKEIMDTISSWRAQQISDTKQISSSLRTIEDSLKFMSAQYEDMLKKVQEMECERRKDKEHILILENKLENLQKSQRKYSFELKNVPKIDNESKNSLINIVTHLSSTLKVDLQPNDIRDVYRSSSKGEKKPIVVEMSSYVQKTNIMTAVKRYNNLNKSNKLNTSHLGLKCTNTPIFVSDHLTPNGNRLYYLGRQLCVALNYKFCWTHLGDVLVRKDENSPIIKLVNESQIQSLYKPTK
ncbi:uncharacterized protein LOC123664381 [Melitaea cinxia]|uniref:uncharacterized protein LOC123664381 n=1 Tax=Melitaea cinxia TaxID=113334 RepID=UPI001E26EFC2|nr:uncharacterized protein LOC123664381 [Melitaea cinxia]